MPEGALHPLPLNVNALPAPSTATQNDADGHDTDLRPYVTLGSTETGDDQASAAEVLGGIATARRTTANTETKTRNRLLPLVLHDRSIWLPTILRRPDQR
jgi:hypothetical protein